MRKILFPILVVISAAACHEVPNTPEGSYFAFYQALGMEPLHQYVEYQKVISGRRTPPGQ